MTAATIQTIPLPEGVEHGTPEGHAAGCKSEKHCPALYEHGMCCLYAKLRSTTLKYFRAQHRDPRPAAIARALGFTPLPRKGTPAMPTTTDPTDTTPTPAAPAGDRAPETRPAARMPEKAPRPASKKKPAVRKAPAPKKPARAPKTPSLVAPLPSQTEVRAWAREQGIPVPPSGRIRGEDITAYLNAQASSGPDHEPVPPAGAPSETTADRPDWATVTTTVHPEDALARIAHLEEQLAQSHISIRVLLESWDTAQHQLAVFRRIIDDLTEAAGRDRDTIGILRSGSAHDRDTISVLRLGLLAAERRADIAEARPWWRRRAS